MSATTGETLCQVMDFEGVSEYELARRTGLEIKTIRRLRRGHLNGHLDSWVKIADALAVSIDTFVEGKE